MTWGDPESGGCYYLRGLALRAQGSVVSGLEPAKSSQASLERGGVYDILVPSLGFRGKHSVDRVKRSCLRGWLVEPGT